MRAAAQATRDRRFIDAVAELSTATALAPTLPVGWYALGQAYADVANEAARTFDRNSEDAAWLRLLAADALFAAGRFVDAFTLYRSTLDSLPAMVSVHDSIARIYERTGHAEWAAEERAAGARVSVDCVRRKALCEFRSGRYRAALDAALEQTDSESRYWRARAATELARAAFDRLNDLPDSVERRGARAARARAEDRHIEAIAELEAALKLAPDQPALIYELAQSCYAVRDYERAVAILSTSVRARPDDLPSLKLLGYSLLRLRRVEEALPVLQRAVDRDGADPGPRLALGRARVQRGDFAMAIPLIEPLLAGDEDGSLHVQLARAYAGIGQQDKAAALLARSEELRRAANDAAAVAARRTITAPIRN